PCLNAGFESIAGPDDVNRHRYPTRIEHAQRRQQDIDALGHHQPTRKKQPDWFTQLRRPQLLGVCGIEDVVFSDPYRRGNVRRAPAPSEQGVAIAGLGEQGDIGPVATPAPNYLSSTFDQLVLPGLLLTGANPGPFDYNHQVLAAQQ